jgi:hypothetical protein
MSAIVIILAGPSAIALSVLIMAAIDDKKRQQQIADRQWKDVEGQINMAGKPRAKCKNPGYTNGGRHRDFKPSQAQKDLVAKLVAMKMQWDEIRLLVINPRTQEPITKMTLRKHFARELAAGSAMLKELVTTKYYEALERGESWAIRTGLKNRMGWAIGFEGAALPTEHAATEAQNIQVTFVVPGRKPQPLIDASPNANPYQGQQPDLSRPAAAPPPERRSGPTGFIEERPKDGSTGWMSE